MSRNKKWPTRPGVCPKCGEFAGSLNGHWRRKHQEVCTIRLHDDPARQIEVRRDQRTGLFHCVGCSEQYDHPRKLQDHVRKECRGTKVFKRVRDDERGRKPLRLRVPHQNGQETQQDDEIQYIGARICNDADDVEMLEVACKLEGDDNLHNTIADSPEMPDLAYIPAEMPNPETSNERAESPIIEAGQRHASLNLAESGNSLEPLSSPDFIDLLSLELQYPDDLTHSQASEHRDLDETSPRAVLEIPDHASDVHPDALPASEHSRRSVSLSPLEELTPLPAELELVLGTTQALTEHSAALANDENALGIFVDPRGQRVVDKTAKQRTPAPSASPSMSGIGAKNRLAILASASLLLFGSGRQYATASSPRRSVSPWARPPPQDHPSESEHLPSDEVGPAPGRAVYAFLGSLPSSRPPPPHFAEAFITLGYDADEELDALALARPEEGDWAALEKELVLEKRHVAWWIHVKNGLRARAARLRASGDSH